MARPLTVEFYYSIGSRYSYLASTQIEKLEAETGCRVEWLPLASRNYAQRGPPSDQWAKPWRTVPASTSNVMRSSPKMTGPEKSAIT